MLKDKTILLGVTGGIAIYKSVDLVSRLKKAGANVEVVMTDAAREFVSPLTFQTMSENVVHNDMFNLLGQVDVEHISLAQKADVILIAPACANTIGKIANGIADNLLTTIVMAATSKTVFATAMNTKMLENPIVQENIDKLKNLGYEFIEPTVGMLACGDYGSGKMAEPQNIVEYLESFFTKKDLEGQKIIVTAGPTREAIDPVRYMSNHSSGKMGYSIAKNAANRGAEVVLISGPSSIEPPLGVKFLSVVTTDDMFKAVESEFEYSDVLIKAAAPSDYKAEDISVEKIKKKIDTDSISIRFVKNPDIARHFGNIKKNRIVVGFAAETSKLHEYAFEKLEKKNLDFIVANDVNREGAGFDGDTNIVSIIDRQGDTIEYPKMDKNEVANIILDKVKYILDEKARF